MSTNSIKRVSFSPDIDDENPKIALKHASGIKILRKRKRVTGIWRFSLPRRSKISPVKFLWRLGAEVAKALRFNPENKKSSGKVSSAGLIRSRSSAESTASHRAEAIEDCIEFLNSSSCSSSLHRSNRAPVSNS